MKYLKNSKKLMTTSSADCVSLVLVNAGTKDNIIFVNLGDVITIRCAEDTIFSPKNHKYVK